jgi:hypothetical protein
MPKKGNEKRNEGEKKGRQGKQGKDVINRR